MIINPILYQQGTKLPELTNPGGAADLLAGKQLVDQYGNPLTGTMPEVTQATPSISVSSSGLITASAAQDAGHVAAGTKSNTKQLTTQSGKTVTPGTSRQTAVASGRYTTGAVYVAGDPNLVAGNIKDGVSIFGVTGSLKPKILSISKDMLHVENNMIYIETGLVSMKIISFSLGVDFGGTKHLYCYGPIAPDPPSPQYIFYAYRRSSESSSGGSGLATCNSQGEIYFANSYGIDSIIGIDYGCVQYL